MLYLDHGVGVDTSEELVRALINDDFLVGLEFHHDNINEVGIHE